MPFKNYLFILSLLVTIDAIQGMDAPPSPDFQTSFIPQNSNEQEPLSKEKMKEVLSVCLALTKIIYDESFKSGISSHKENNNSELFRPVFDGKGVRQYTKIDPDIMKSSLENCPKFLQFQIHLMKNRVTYQSLNAIKQFSMNKILLYGPPGSGKSTLAKAIADYCDFPRQFITASSLFNRYKNSGQVNFRHVFEPFTKSDDYFAIILDELTGLIDKKNNYDKGTIEQLSGILDSFESHKNILFIATTNEITKLPEQIKDRFCGSMHYIPLMNDQKRDQFCATMIYDHNAQGAKKKDDSEIVSDDKIVIQPLEFRSELSYNDIALNKKKTKKFSMRQINALGCLSMIYALKRYVDQDYNVISPEITITGKDYISAIEYLIAIKRVCSENSWQYYYKIFKEAYRFIMPVFQTFINSYLQYKSIHHIHTNQVTIQKRQQQWQENFGMAHRYY